MKVPSSDEIVANAKNIVIKGKAIHFWIAEKDGTPSKRIGKFRGKRVTSNARCPDQLHEEWFAYDENKEDKSTRGVKFRTWHPAWDPCYWWYVCTCPCFSVDMSKIRRSVHIFDVSGWRMLLANNSLRHAWQF